MFGLFKKKMLKTEEEKRAESLPRTKKVQFEPMKVAEAASAASPPTQQDQSGGGYEIWQYINEFVISCACVALCRAGAFCLSDFWTLCPEVRGGSPGCRSPPAPHFVSAQPINRNKMEDKL